MKTKLNASSEPIKRLKQLQQGFNTADKTNILNNWEYAILAGGAIRDMYFNKADQISDYDIFIKSNDQTSEQIEEIIRKVFPNLDYTTQLFDSKYLTLEEQQDLAGDVKPGPNLQIADVWEVDEDQFKYQLIFTKERPVLHLEKYFDIGLCKAYCDGRKIRYTHDFLHDVNHKTMTIVGDDMTKEQVEYAIYHHANKLQWKYMFDFQVVVPQRYQHFVEGCGFPTF